VSEKEICENTEKCVRNGDKAKETQNEKKWESEEIKEAYSID
jgi:hypothetical protein